MTDERTVTTRETALLCSQESVAALLADHAEREAALRAEVEALRAERDALFEVAQAIEGALRFAPAAEVLDEHSPIRDGLRAALALAKDAEARR